MKAQSRGDIAFRRLSCSLFFLIDSLKYLDVVLSKIKEMPETAFSAPFSSTLKETTLSEKGV